MRRQLDIVDVEERTKIRAKYLRALENEEWGSLPGPTFVKTFLRTYAEVVGVDAHLLVEEYRAGHEAEEGDLQPLAGPPVATRRDPGRERRRPPGPPGRGIVIGALAVVLVGFLLVLGLVGGDDDGGSDGQGAGDPVVDDAERTERARERRRRERREARPPAADGVRLRIAPAVDTYACLDTGEGSDVVFEGILAEAQTFTNPELLRVNLGKRSVALTVNGEPVAIEDSPEPLGLEVTPAGTEEILDGSRPCA